MTLPADIAPISFKLVAEDLPRAAERLGDAFQRTGFAVITDHGIDQASIDLALARTKAFFAMPETVKRQYVVGTGGARGYTPFGIETAKDASRPDLKEFWHTGRDLHFGHRYADQMPPNVWPDGDWDFRIAIKEMFHSLDYVGNRVLEAIAVHLGLQSDFFDVPTQDGNSSLRLLHYPPLAADAEGERAGAHEDINVITLLLGAEEAGLQLLDRSGQWRDIPVPPGALVCNVGDMLQRLTNNRLPSTTHRVVNPAPERRGFSRYSMPFFLHFAPDYLIKTLPECVDDEHPDLYPAPITANDYLMQRLREIGVL